MNLASRRADLEEQITKAMAAALITASRPLMAAYPDERERQQFGVDPLLSSK